MMYFGRGRANAGRVSHGLGMGSPGKRMRYISSHFWRSVPGLVLDRSSFSVRLSKPSSCCAFFKGHGVSDRWCCLSASAFLRSLQQRGQMNSGKACLRYICSLEEGEDICKSCNSNKKKTRGQELV